MILVVTKATSTIPQCDAAYGQQFEKEEQHIPAIFLQELYTQRTKCMRAAWVIDPGITSTWGL